MEGTLGQIEGSYQWLEFLYRLNGNIASSSIFWNFLRTWFSLHNPIPLTGFECLSFQAAFDIIQLWRSHSLFLKTNKYSEYLACNKVQDTLYCVSVV